jgi:hypothetical protein
MKIKFIECFSESDMKLFKDSLMSNQKIISLEIDFKTKNPESISLLDLNSIDPQILNIFFNGIWENKTLKSLRLNCKEIFILTNEWGTIIFTLFWILFI